jgi:flagellar hook-associated protein 2
VTIRGADGTLVTVEPTSGSLQDIANAVNAAADAGIKATVVRVSGGATPTYRLQFTGTTTGTDGAFEVYKGDSETVQAAIDAGTQASLRLDGTSVQTATDAQITLWKGSSAEQVYTQSSNTFTDLLTGVDVTIAEETTDPVTVTVGHDSDALATLVSNLVSSMGVVLSEIASRTATTTTTESDGSIKVTGGLLSGDSVVRNAQESLTSALLSPVDGLSPSTIGITYNSDGTFSFDEATFLTALADDPAGVQSMATQLASNVADVADTLSDSTTGSISLKIAGQQSLVKDYGEQIDNWDVRLELRRSTLQAQFTSLETTLSTLQAQSSWLASQLSSLSSNSSSS